MVVASEIPCNTVFKHSNTIRLILACSEISRKQSVESNMGVVLLVSRF